MLGMAVANRLSVRVKSNFATNLMKTISSFTDSPFYHPAASLGGVWYDQPRTASRPKTSVCRRYILEQDERKQEVVCSIILTLCLMFAFATCLVQFAVS